MRTLIKSKWIGYINIREYIDNRADFRRKTLPGIKWLLLGGRKDE